MHVFIKYCFSVVVSCYILILRKLSLTSWLRLGNPIMWHVTGVKYSHINPPHHIAHTFHVVLFSDYILLSFLLLNMQLDLHGLFEHNSSFDYSDYEYKDDCNIRRSILAIFVPILYSVALILGLIGNVLVLVVLWQKRHNWSITDPFVLHLSVADVLLLLTMPLLAVDAVKGWSFGSGLCKLTGVLFKVGN